MSDTTTTAPGTPAPAAAPAADAPAAPATGGSAAAPSPAQSTAAVQALATATEAPDNSQGERQWTIKVNGKEKTVGEAEMVKLAQMADGASDKFKEAAELRKAAMAEKEQVAKLLGTIKDGDTFDLLERLGIDVYGKAEAYFARRLAEEQMDPQERRARDLDRRERSLQEQEQARQRAEAEQQLSRAAQEYQVRFEADLSSALDKAGVRGLDRAEYIPRAAMLMEASLDDNGVPTVTIDDIAQIIAQEEGGRRTKIRELTMAELDALDGDALLEALPASLVEKTRAALLSKVKNPLVASPRMTPIASHGKAQEKPKERVVVRNAADLRKYRESRNGG